MMRVLLPLLLFIIPVNTSSGESCESSWSAFEHQFFHWLASIVSGVYIYIVWQAASRFKCLNGCSKSFHPVITWSKSAALRVCFCTFGDCWCLQQVVIRASSQIISSLSPRWFSRVPICLVSCIQTILLTVILINKTRRDQNRFELNGIWFRKIASVPSYIIETSLPLSKKYILALSTGILTN